MSSLLTISDAIISECGEYRYRLTRRWGPKYAAMFVMLNPSTADASQDDPTIRRCIGFAKDAGFGGIEVVNLFAFRATSPKDMKAASDPVGPDNKAHVAATFQECSMVVCGWGAHGSFNNQDQTMLEWLRMAGAHADNIRSLGLTKDGQPRHPLYLPKKALWRTYPPPQATDSGGPERLVRKPGS